MCGVLLRETLECERRSCGSRIEDLVREHSEEVKRVTETEREKGREEKEKLCKEWHRDNKQREMKFSEEVRIVREEVEREKWEVVRTEQAKHQQEIGKKPILVIPPVTPHHTPQLHCRVFRWNSTD